MKRSLLTVAGFDPTGGAGIILDIKVFELLGFNSLSIITSHTVQNTRIVNRFYPLKAEIILEQYESLRKDIEIHGIKVGMIGGKENLPSVQYILKTSNKIPCIVDPVFKSSSGDWLIEETAIEEYIEKLVPFSDIITPNIIEAGIIIKREIKTLVDMKKAAERIFKKWKVKSVIKGGHLGSKKAIDVAFDGDEFYFFEKDKLEIKVHGTGCFFSSALLGFICKNYNFSNACFSAKELTFKAIKNSKTIGKGQRIINFDALKF